MAHRNIYRIDIDKTPEHPRRCNTHGWQVRATRQGKQTTRFFGDARYGGSEAALEAAQRYLAELIPVLPPPDSATALSAAARSRTGVPGLSFCCKADDRPYVQLSWMQGEGPSRRRKAGSVAACRRGLRAALWIGCKRLAREKGTPEAAGAWFATAYAAITEQYPELAEDA